MTYQTRSLPQIEALDSSPFTRDSSPSPSVSPTPALSACPSLERSFSTTSSVSNLSERSPTVRSCSDSSAPRRRGYVRPQGAAFSASAKNRDSVMSLGSIAHLQYYFARTGLLDGKGAQLAQAKKKAEDFNGGYRMNAQSPLASPDVFALTQPSPHSDGHFYEENEDLVEPLMLLPTVSTYSHRAPYIPPIPNINMLRQELDKSLNDASIALCEVQRHTKDPHCQRENQIALHIDREVNEAPESSSPCLHQSQGWNEIQGIHILDLVTLAIRAAKIYYTNHENPERLYAIKTERRIREDLLCVMDILRRMASRNFAGGIKSEELKSIGTWVSSVQTLMTEELAVEKQEIKDRTKWEWLASSWQGQERERERLFMSSFLPASSLPPWEPLDQAKQVPTSFLLLLQNGVTLINLHNAVLKKSRRQFGEIKASHADTAKPYRRAENLRFWIKAAEIRWEIKLNVDVTGVVHGRDGAWAGFDDAILQWCKSAREELTEEWRSGTVQVPSPTFQGKRSEGDF